MKHPINLKNNMHTINTVKEGYCKFLLNCLQDNGNATLTIEDKYQSPYALCFLIFGLHLLKKNNLIHSNRDRWFFLLKNNINKLKESLLLSSIKIEEDKSYLQLLSFTLSSLYILDYLVSDPLEDHVLPLIQTDIFRILENKGTFKGMGQSGNFSMFYAVLLEHARLYLDIDTNTDIKEWIERHLETINDNGFWGNDKHMTYLQFQNGYHQYEMLHYFGAGNKLYDKAATNVALMADEYGHYAPYPGGGGCFDYDAVFILTIANIDIVDRNIDLLNKTFQSILKSQNTDGGFSESHFIRPLGIKNILLMLNNIIKSDNNSSRFECLKYCLTLLRSKHNNINTHWSINARRWSESNLWDSWFRMLTIARIDVLRNKNNRTNWGFINYPGIGYY
jgi:hypothetical protein